MTDILQAARSYYGLADTHSCTTQLFTNQAGQACVAFEIPLSPEDFIAIGERMKAMQAIEKHEVVADQVQMISTEIMRIAYNKLSKEERGRYGSFARFMAEASNGFIEAEDQGVGGRKVAHIDAPETEEPTTMDAVWILGNDLEGQQVHLASDARFNEEADDNEYLLRTCMLTDEQKQKAKEAKP